MDNRPYCDHGQAYDMDRNSDLDITYIQGERHQDLSLNHHDKLQDKIIWIRVRIIDIIMVLILDGSS